MNISLLYHDVLPTGAGPDASGFSGADADVYKLPEALFEAHLSAIAGGLSPVAVARVVFTFDDGGVTADEPTARLLESRGWRGEFFIVTARIGKPGFLTREQISALRKRGHLIGSHSHTHPAGFSRLSYSDMVIEWRKSREILEELLGEKIESASVPGGFYSREVARAAFEAGYRVLYNSEPSASVCEVEGLKVLGRFGIQRGTSARRALELARGDLTPRLRQAMLWNAKKPLKKLGGPAWLAFRRWVFNRLD